MALMSDFKEFFSKNAEAYAHSQSHKKGEDLQQLVEAVNPISSDVAIDLASGTGFTAMALAPLVSKVVAYDGTEEMLQKARELAAEDKIQNLDFSVGDVANLPYSDNTFDIATCRRAAHHFTDKKKFLSEAFRVLKKGGRIGVVDMAVPEADNNDIFNHIEIIRDHSHIAAEKLETWKNLIGNAGFRITKVISSSEEYTLERWLSPVKMDSKEGNELQIYLKETPDKLLINGNINREEGTILKERFVIVAEKP
jgi:ubiquinone/menaquinone biosynthesis C-methylase UbiE